ncbi:hypothetical protein SEA_LYSIDIOUS_43 [Gordonia phage Lysidious]|nr:hypothetical protein SEA_LYSIDIOUS_43 [Gordonia phage Lysidious]
MSTEPSHDSDRWPLAPGNASEDVEAALRAEEARWPEPTAAQRSRIASVFRRTDRRAASA